jgi:hypothetical protein
LLKKNRPAAATSTSRRGGGKTANSNWLSAGASNIKCVSAEKVIRIELRRVKRSVVGLGECTFRAASNGVERDLSWHYKQPHRVDYRRFSNELISRCLEEPEPSPAHIDRLSGRTRAGLRAGVVTACELDTQMRGLRGSPLGLDERLFAAMMWHYQEWTVRFGELIVGFGMAAGSELSRVIESFKPQIRKLESGIANILGSSGLLHGSTEVSRTSDLLS